VRLNSLKILYSISCVALCLIILSPTIANFVSLPEGERYSELYLLGPTHMMEDYPFNISAGALYPIYLGVVNHMGGLEYYAIHVKFRNHSESSPDSLLGTASDLASIFEYRFFLGNNQTWEKEVVFSLNGVSFSGNVSRVSKVSVDGYSMDVEKTALWDEEEGGFYFQIFFELWIYNSTISDFQFHQRFVGLWLNI
jgi:hypothetical protein